MDISNVIKSDDKLLELMTYICCGLSAVALLVTLLCLLGIRSLRCRRSYITSNLCLSLFFVDMIMIFGLQQTEFKVVCAVIAGVLHFFLLSAFCWMLLEGYHLYHMVIVVFSRSSQLAMRYFYCFGYGIPAVIVSVTASLRLSDYGRSDFCWLSNDHNVLWSFVGPACLIMLTNLVIFILTMRSASSLKIKKEQSTAENIKSMLKGSISITCLLGLTWCVGLLYSIKVFYFSSYIFTALNGLQGVFIFVFHILLNAKARTAFKDAFRDTISRHSSRTNTIQVMTSTSSHHKNNKHSPTGSLIKFQEGKQNRRGSSEVHAQESKILDETHCGAATRGMSSYSRRSSCDTAITHPQVYLRDGSGRSIAIRANGKNSKTSNEIRSFTANIESKKFKSKNYTKSKETVSVSFVM